jgi:hypothetical protein
MRSYHRASFESLIIVGIVFVASYMMTDLSTVFRWTGSTCGIALGFMIPSAMFYKLQLIEEEQAELARRIMTYHQSLPDTNPMTPSASRSAKDRTWKKISSACIFVLSSGYALFGLLTNLGVVSDAYQFELSTYIFVN